MANPIKHDPIKYLFIEDSIIDEMFNTCKILNSPSKYAGNPILRPSQPWEHNVGFIGSVLKNDTSGLIKTWYQNWIDDNYRVGYATSLNGVHWEKPDCGMYEVKGKPTNQVMASGCTPNVIYEPADPDQNKRYKMLFWDYDMWQTQNTASGSIAFSKDGIHWNRAGHIAIDYRNKDEYAISVPRVIFENSTYKMWYSYRASPKGDTYRIGYAESADGISWERKDEEVGIDVSENGWDSEMIEYPFVFDHEGQRYMFYNGNEFGKEGVGLARIER